MNIDDLTIGQARELSAMFGSQAPTKRQLLHRYIGRVVVVRSHLSGVWFGCVSAVDGSALTLTDARRAHGWKGSSCSGLATHGPLSGRICASVPEVTILDTIEVLAASEASVKRLDAVAGWVL